VSRVSGKAYFAYVLWSDKARKYYIGISDSPDSRLVQHNSIDNRSWTKRYQPWRLVWRQEFATFTLARRCELRLKAHKGGIGFYAETGLNRDAFRVSSSSS